MAIDDADLEKLSRLTRIRLSDDEKGAVKDSLNRVLAMVDELQQADVSGTDAMAHVQSQPLRCRPPGSVPGYAPAVVVQNAPDHDDGYFLVPKVIE